MKRLLSFILVFIMIVLGGNSVFAESEYDFIEYDVETNEKRIVKEEDRDFGDIPEKTNPRLPRGTRNIIGEYDREIVEDSTKFPYSAIVKVNARTPQGSLKTCSGSLISSDIVLTAAHCIGDHENGVFVPWLSFTARPGYQDYVAPFGTAYAEKYYYLAKYEHSDNVDNDLAIIKLDRNIGNETGWLGLDYNPDKSDLFTMVGFGSPTTHTMKKETRDIPLILSGRDSWEEEFVWHIHDTASGDSGAASYDSNYRVAMVYRGGAGEVNGSVRISEGKYKMIYSIMNAEVPVESISISPNEIEIGVNEKISLITTITPNNATNKNIIYTSSDETIATVSDTGEVTGVRAGIVTITVTSEDGSKTATITVTVKSGSMIIVTSELNNNGILLSGSEFELEDLNGNIVRNGITTNVFGKVTVSNLAPGEYNLIQTKAKNGYITSDTQKIMIVAGQTKVVNIYNEKESRGGLVITNTDGENSNILLSGSEFRLEDLNGNIVKENIITAFDGIATINNLPAGEYYIVQVKVNNAYSLDSRPKKITINDGRILVLRIKNYEL